MHENSHAHLNSPYTSLRNMPLSSVVQEKQYRYDYKSTHSLLKIQREFDLILHSYFWVASGCPIFSATKQKQISVCLQQTGEGERRNILS